MPLIEFGRLRIALAAAAVLLFLLISFISTSSLQLETITRTAGLGRYNSDVLLYAYFETENAARNLKFFVDHGLHNKMDFVFIINGENLSVDIPVASNIKVIRRPNTCFDLGSYGEILRANDSAIKKKYKRFAFLNASVRGPFMPRWTKASKLCWSDMYLNHLDEEVKAVGISANCNDLDPYHLQSMLLAFDQQGLDAAMPALACVDNWHDAVYQGETVITGLVRDAGFRAEPVYSMRDRQLYNTPADFWVECNNFADDPFFPNRYDGMDVHPFDTLFTKTDRLKTLDDGAEVHVSPFSEEGTRTLQTLTDWADRSEYSSYDYCK